MCFENEQDKIINKKLDEICERLDRISPKKEEEKIVKYTHIDWHYKINKFFSEYVDCRWMEVPVPRNIPLLFLERKMFELENKVRVGKYDGVDFISLDNRGDLVSSHVQAWSYFPKEIKEKKSEEYIRI